MYFVDMGTRSADVAVISITASSSVGFLWKLLKLQIFCGLFYPKLLYHFHSFELLRMRLMLQKMAEIASTFRSRFGHALMGLTLEIPVTYIVYMMFHVTIWGF